MFRPEAIVRHRPFNAEAPAEALAAPVTPAAAHYVRSNFDVPAIATAGYRLELCALDGQITTFTLDDLRALGTVDVVVTLECAGNDRVTMRPLPPGETWRGGAVSTGQWGGVPLQRVLDAAGMARPGVVEVLVSGADRGRKDEARVRYQRALPADLAWSAVPILALTLNDAPISAEHGAPLRLVMPGWYAMASVKWVTGIEALREPFAGYFHRDRYVYRTAEGERPVREMLVKSIITSPAEGEMMDRATTHIRGWAWSGSGAIRRVEVSTGADDGWQEAILEAPASPHAWTGWHCAWTPAEPGHHVLRARATDASGAVQPDVAEWNALGYGNNAIQPRSVIVR